MKSPLTTVFGAISACGAAVVGAEATGMLKPADVPHWLNLTAILCVVIGGALAHFFARDNGTSDEAAGARPDWVRPKDPNSGFAIHEILIVVACVGLLVLLICSGCATLDKGADPIVVRAEQALTISQAAFDAFLKLDDADRALVAEKLPAVHAFATWLRVPTDFPGSTQKAAKWAALVESAELTKLAYKKNRTADNKATLITALSALETAAAQAQSQLAQIQTLTH